MYIAFKWLVGLTCAMWMAMCFIDVILLRVNPNIITESNVKSFENIVENATVYREVSQEIIEEYDGTPLLNYIMFLAGALAISVYHKKEEIVCFILNMVSRIEFCEVIAYLKKFKEIPIPDLTVKEKLMKTQKLCVATLNYCRSKCEVLLQTTKNVMSNINYKRESVNSSSLKLNMILIGKLAQIMKEKKNMSHILLAALKENKNCRTRHQLDTLAKNRLIRHIEETHKQIRENRSKYINFQQLYIVTHQENIFLKARLKKLTEEKEQSEKNLMSLVNEIYCSNNTKLKEYSARFIVHTQDGLLESNLGLEVEEFLKKCESRKANSRSIQETDNSLQFSGNPQRFEAVMDNISEDNTLVPMANGPKLRGLPGEYMWTVKDKNGIIEKLYECEFESNYDNGDTVQKIRQYSVYYDEDCLLDFSDSNTLMREQRNFGRPNSHYTVQNQKFLTDSEAFKNFMKNVDLTKRSRTRLLPS